jgi:hypothetical protein
VGIAPILLRGVYSIAIANMDLLYICK